MNPPALRIPTILTQEGDCWICMELMDSSLDKFYHFIFDDLQQTLPEAVIGEKNWDQMKYS